MIKGLDELRKIELKWQYGAVTFTPNFEIIEKELEALNIIKENDVDIFALKISASLEQYNCKEDGRCPLTQEEYDLLREVLL